MNNTKKLLVYTPYLLNFVWDRFMHILVTALAEYILFHRLLTECSIKSITYVELSPTADPEKIYHRVI